MRRLTALLAFAALLLLAGCGGGHQKATSPLDDALGYFPNNASLVAAVETDPDGSQVKQVVDLVKRFPGAGVSIVAQRIQELTRFGALNWSDDVRPQLGAPLIVGLERPAAGSGLSVPLVLAIRVKHPRRLKQLILRQPGFRGHGTASGVRIFEDPAEQRYLAVDGSVLVAATNRETLAHALALRRSDNRMRAAGFQQDLSGLPSGGVVRVSADPRAIVGSDPRLRPALDVKWIGALRRMGAVAKASPTGVTLDFRARTDAGGLAPGDLPLSPRSTRLPLMGSGSELQLAVGDPSRLVRLAFAVWHATAPSKLAAFAARQPAGVDLERQIPHHLTGPALLAIDPQSKAFAFRSLLTESNDVRAALAALAPRLPDLAALLGLNGLGVASPAAGESFYALAKPDGKSAVFGVLGNELIAASEAARAARLVSEPTHTLPSVKGGAEMTLDARRLAASLLARRLPGPAAILAPLFASSLRDLSGSLSNTRGELRGHFKLTIVK